MLTTKFVPHMPIHLCQLISEDFRKEEKDNQNATLGQWGQLCFPILSDKAVWFFSGTWFEFTPHEAGYAALGAFVSTKHFGSEFEKGKLKKKNKKKHICYMQGKSS